MTTCPRLTAAVYSILFLGAGLGCQPSIRYPNPFSKEKIEVSKLSTSSEWQTTITEEYQLSRSARWTVSATTADNNCTIKEGMWITLFKPQPGDTWASASFEMEVKYNGTPDSKAHHLHESVRFYDANGFLLCSFGPVDSVDLMDTDYHKWHQGFSIPATFYSQIVHILRSPATAD